MVFDEGAITFGMTAAAGIAVAFYYFFIYLPEQKRKGEQTTLKEFAGDAYVKEEKASDVAEDVPKLP